MRFLLTFTSLFFPWSSGESRQGCFVDSLANFRTDGNCPQFARTQWILAAPDTANGIRIRIHVISHPSRLEYLAAELSAYGEAQAVYEQSKERIGDTAGARDDHN